MTEINEQEFRIHPRKLFHCHARLSFDNTPPIDVWTIDISLGGISLMLPAPTDPYQYCIVKFNATADGKSQLFSAIAKSLYQVSDANGLHRTGFQFIGLSAENTAIINQLEG